MSMRWTWALVFLAALGCTRANPLAGADAAAGVPGAASHDGGAADLGAPVERDAAAPGPPGKVDLLFLIDDSESMQPKQAALAAQLMTLVTTLDAATRPRAIWYHIGVVTSDLGAGFYNTTCAFPGDGAKLIPVGRAADPNACAPLAGMARFIDYDSGGGASNLPAGESLAQAFTCAASVGDIGCGFEQQLEASYRALHDPITENAGFLRPDALLVVVYLTDEDDCSAPDTTDLFSSTAGAAAMYGPLSSFRCTQFGIACGSPPTAVQPVDSMGPLSGCVPLSPADGGKLIDVHKYIDFFTRPAAEGGVKADPRDVILAALAAPTEPFATAVETPCTSAENAESCAVLRHSCTSAVDPQIVGDPPVRLRAVIDAAASHVSASVCDSDYSGAMQAIAQRILDRLP